MEKINKKTENNIIAVLVMALAMITFFFVVEMSVLNDYASQIDAQTYYIEERFEDIEDRIDQERVYALDIINIVTERTNVTLVNTEGMYYDEILFIEEMGVYGLADVVTDRVELKFIYECNFVTDVMSSEKALEHNEYCIFNGEIPDIFYPTDMQYLIVQTEIGDIWYFL